MTGVIIEVRPAKTSDMPLIRRLVDFYADKGILLSKPTVTLFEDIQEFVIAEVDGEPMGCGALHVLWSDLAEVRTVAVDPLCQHTGVGHAILSALLVRARTVGVQRVFCLTFAVRSSPNTASSGSARRWSSQVSMRNSFAPTTRVWRSSWVWSA